MVGHASVELEGDEDNSTFGKPAECVYHVLLKMGSMFEVVHASIQSSKFRAYSPDTERYTLTFEMSQNVKCALDIIYNHLDISFTITLFLFMKNNCVKV